MSLTFHPEQSAPTHSLVECLTCHVSVRIPSPLDAESLALAIASGATRVPGCRGTRTCPTQVLVSTGSDDLDMPSLTIPDQQGPELLGILGYTGRQGRAGVPAVDFAGHVLIAVALGDMVVPAGGPTGAGVRHRTAGQLRTLTEVADWARSHGRPVYWN